MTSTYSLFYFFKKKKKEKEISILSSTIGPEQGPNWSW
jgi:hypothetical protein